MEENNISFKLLEPLILNPKFNQSVEKDIILFVGETGVGKSTVINYLLGRNFIRDTDDEDKPIATPVQEQNLEDASSSVNYPEIGQDSVIATTLYAEVFGDLKNKIFYCDCPGFHDNRGAEEKVCIAISTELAVKSASSVKAIAVVLDWNECSQGKFSVLDKTCETLGDLLSDFKCASSILFLINNKQPTHKLTPQKIVEKAHRIKQEIMDGKINRDKDKENIKICTVLKMIEENQSNIFMLNIFDEGKSRQALIEVIENKKFFINKSVFNFSNYNPSRKKFDQIVFEMSGIGRGYFAKYSAIKENIQTNINLLNSAHAEGSLLERINQFLSLDLSSHAPVSPNVKVELINFFETSKILLQEEIQENECRKNKLEKLVQTIKDNLEKIDTDEPIVHFDSEENDPRRFLGNFSLFNFKTTKTFTYNGIPFEDVNCFQRNGKFKDEKKEKGKGFYEVWYESESGQDGYAKIEILVAKRNIPDNKKLIEQYKQEELNNQEKLNSVLLTLKNLSTKKIAIEKCKELINDSSHINYLEVQNIIKDWEEIQKRRSAKNLEAIIEVERDKLYEVEGEIQQRETVFKLIFHLSNLLNYQGSSLVSRFSSDYQKYLAEKEEIEALLKSNLNTIAQLKQSIDEDIKKILDCEYENFLFIESTKNKLKEFLPKTISSTNQHKNHYLLYLELCNVWLVGDSDSRYSILKEIFIKLKMVNKNILDGSQFIVKILFNEFRSSFLTKEAFISFLDSYFKEFLQILGEKLDISAGATEWIVVHKIVDYIDGRSGNENKFLMEKLASFINILQNSFLKREFLLVVPNYFIHRKNLLERICEKPTDVSKFILSKFINSSEKAEIYGDLLIYLIRLNQSQLFQSVFMSFNKFSLDTCFLNGQTLLMASVEKENENLVIFLLGKDAEVSKKSIYQLKDGSFSRETISPLHFAIQNGYEEILAIFLNHAEQKKKFASLLNEGTQNLLHVAVKVNNGKNTRIFKKLFEKIPKEERQKLMNQKDIAGFTPLHYIIKNGDTDLFNWLHKQNGIDVNLLVNQRTKDDNNALHLAVMSQDFNLVQTVITVPATFWSKNKEDKTPFQLAKLVAENKGIKSVIKDKVLKYFVYQLKEQIEDILSGKLNEQLFYWLRQIDTVIYQSPQLKNVRKAILNLEESQINILAIANSVASVIIDKCSAESQKHFENRDAASYDDYHLFENSLAICLNQIFQVPASEKSEQLFFPARVMIASPENRETEQNKQRQKGFIRSFKEALSYLFYTSLAIVEGKVQLADDSFDSVTRLFHIISPVMSSYMTTYTGSGMTTSILFSISSGFLEAVKLLRKEKALLQANAIVEAFRGGAGYIDRDLLKDLAEAFYFRFKSQINRMTVSSNSNGELRLSEMDGVVTFANAIAQRISVHIMAGHDEFVDESNIQLIRSMAILGSHIKNNFTHWFGDPQTIQPKTKTPILQRCLMATWKQQLINLDIPIEITGTRKGEKITWAVGNILCHSGICVINSENVLTYYWKEGCFKEEVGYCLATKEEVNLRGFSEVPNQNKQLVLSRETTEEEKATCLVM